MTAHRPEWRAVVLKNGTTAAELTYWMPVYGSLYACPRCGAVVEGRRRYVHEDWHAATDYPMPEDLRQELARGPALPA
jgi:hypothetical protein